MKKINNEVVDNILSYQESSINGLVFSGGGAKGAGYGGVYLALKPFMKDIEYVSGSSAGAMVSALIATGIQPEELSNIVKNTNFKDLLGSGFLVQRGGEPLYDFMSNTIKSGIRDFLQNTNTEKLCKERIELIIKERESIIEQANQQIKQDKTPELEESTNYLKFRLERLDKQLNVLTNLHDTKFTQIKEIEQKAKEKHGKIYFRDLELLRALDPKRFKDLHLTAVNARTGELEIFNTQDTPDVEISLAAKASSALPVLFKQVQIKNTHNNDYYVDGGYRDNIPIKYFPQYTHSNQSKDITNNKVEIEHTKRSGRNLVFIFDNETAHKAIYSNAEKITSFSKLKEFILDVVFKLIARVKGNFKYTQEEEETYQGVRKQAMNTIPLKSNVGTTDFGKAQTEAEYLELRYENQTMQFLSHHGLMPPNENIKYQEFLLDVYADTKINPCDQKTILLECCKVGNISPPKQLERYLLTAALDSSGRIKLDSTPMQQLVETLNKPDTQLSIKSDLIALMSQYTSNHHNVSDIRTFKFKASDFDFLKSQQFIPKIKEQRQWMKAISHKNLNIR